MHTDANPPSGPPDDRAIGPRSRDDERANDPRLQVQALLDGAKDACLLADTDGRIIRWSSAAERLYGHNAQEACGQSLALLVPAQEKESMLALLERARHGDTVDDYSMQHVRRGGMAVPVCVTVRCISDDERHCTGFCVFVRDASEQKHLEEVFRKLNRDLHHQDGSVQKLEHDLGKAREAAAAAKLARDNFIASMNHEIRTALASILGYAEMMYDAKQTVSERLNCIGRIRQNAKGLTELVEDMLDLSRMEAGSLDLRATRFPLVAALEETLSMLQSQAWKKRLSLNYSFEGPIPETIQADPRRLRQILLNVIGNAIKFTERGAINIFVRLAPSPKEEHKRLLKIEVRDTGCGVTPEQKASLFEPFTQGGSTMIHPSGGIGLGLCLSRQLARAMGGDIELTDTQPGRGSTFTITLDPGPLEGTPVLEKTGSQDEYAHHAPLRIAEKKLDGMRVLLVEDSRDIQILVSHFLRKSGAEVEVAENGYEGIKKAKANRYDLILMDIQMPVLSGYEATQQLHKVGIRSPIVALTAHAMKGVRERCIQAGCDDYLTKPINATALLELIQRYYRRDRNAYSG